MTEIPLILLNLQNDGFHLLVEVTVFDKPFRAVLDTGASKTVFDKASVETHIDPELIKPSDQLSTGLGTNTMESYTLTIPDFKIGDLHLKNYEAAVLDLSTINIAYQQLDMEPVIGVIGGDLLYEYKAKIDYESRSLCLGLSKR
ncbi:retropepsin-like aspartic protease [Albibacterium indicum]|uniref:retropepsin-like aspartic protease n=1 Tax=Albibacterium indicum TaxID=2292082 RepID=UPI000E4F4F00|nr:retropepsin-like aspartic protease [Pedobacter indicus]